MGPINNDVVIVDSIKISGNNNESNTNNIVTFSILL